MILQTGEQHTAEPAMLNSQLGQHRIVELVAHWNKRNKTTVLTFRRLTSTIVDAPQR